MSDIAGKSVVITGASKGIGAAAARLCAEQGAKVALLARSKEAIESLADEINNKGGVALPLCCDVACLEEMKNAFDGVVTHFGSMDVLVNNAGLIDPIARLGESDPFEWAHVIDVNLKGVYYGIRLALPLMQARGGGTIINISSGAAYNALEGWSHYCASKAAVLSLTKSTDKEYRARGIRAIGLSPGTVATDMQREIKASGINPVSQMDFEDHIPADWVAKAIVHLCGSGGDAYLGTDFSLKTDEGRAEVGLPPIGQKA